MFLIEILLNSSFVFTFNYESQTSCSKNWLEKLARKTGAKTWLLFLTTGNLEKSAHGGEKTGGKLNTSGPGEEYLEPFYPTLTSK